MSYRFAAAFLAVLVALSRGDEIKYEEDVMVLTDSNFDGAVAENKYLLVEFYAPWCGHCKALAPEYAKAAGKLKEEGAEPKLAKVDATEQKKAAEKYKVEGYPTLKFFKNGTPVEYQGGRTADEIVNWLKKKTGPASQVLASKEEADKFIADSEVVVVGHFPDAEGEEFKTFMSVADSVDDVPFGHITDAETAEALDIKANSIVVFKKFDDERVDYEGEWKVDDIVAFIKGNQLPLVSEFTQESAQKIFGGSITTHNLLFIKKSADDFQKIYDDFKKAAAEFKGQVLFIYIDADSEENLRVMEFFGLEAKDCPDYRIVKMDEDMAKYKPPTKDLDSQSVIDFTNKVVSGEVSRHLNSQEVPDDWDKNPVKVLVGKNFREVAFDAKKKVLVEFYAPWCGHCKQLAPIWDKLGDKYKDSADIVIAKMDSTANEIEEVKVQGFPTLKYFPDDKEENVIDYNGDRTFDALVKFIDSDGKEITPQSENDLGGGMPDMEEYLQDERDVTAKEPEADVPGGTDSAKLEESDERMLKERLEEQNEAPDVKADTVVSNESKHVDPKDVPEIDPELLKKMEQMDATFKNVVDPFLNMTKEEKSKKMAETRAELERRAPPEVLKKMDEMDANIKNRVNPFLNMTQEEKSKKMAEMQAEFEHRMKELNEEMRQLQDPKHLLKDLKNVLPDENPTSIPGLKLTKELKEKMEEQKRARKNRDKSHEEL